MYVTSQCVAWSARTAGHTASTPTVSEEDTVTATQLNSETRQAALREMSEGAELDVLVIGGGITGAGIALDAATRGLRTGIVEAQHWAGGT
ncbi:FAD-dependent oxidoreductase, partial [Streptomyces sp. tea 10]|nr:FAD-dependent oxidoreductase [Streptomyces sp. tea 10]